MDWAKTLIVGVLVIASVMTIASAIIAMAPYLAAIIVIVIILKILLSSDE